MSGGSSIGDGLRSYVSATGGKLRPCISSIGGKFLTSSALIPFSFIDFFASCISVGLRNRTPLFFGVGLGIGSGAGSGSVQLFSFVNILFNRISASSGVLSLKIEPTQLPGNLWKHRLVHCK